MQKEIIAWNPPTAWIKEQIENAGTTIGSVHFHKRKGGELRKMSYRLHVTNPSVAAAPKGTKMERICKVCGKKESACKSGPYRDVSVKKSSKSKKDIDSANTQMTVLDANKVVRDVNGKVIGRGAWRTVPLEKVIRIANRGITYLIQRD